MVIGEAASAGQAAPGELESVRALLNSWLIPNDSRQPTDTFGDYAREHGWRPRQAAVMRELRDEIRQAVEAGEPRRLNHWIERLDVRPEICDGAIAYQHTAGPAGAFLATVLTAVSRGNWSRLKACPDCRWVFYDNTRNGSKRWCLMYAGGPDGRACGTIAKVRRYRDRWADADIAPHASTAARANTES